MKKANFFTGVYDEFIHYITWTKWNKLQSSTLVVAFSTILLSLVLYGIDEVFIWALRQLFSLHF
ncbi:MAG: preprotein translocase subunit SecE [Flavobacteriales bacterium AspAUS03]